MSKIAVMGFGVVGSGTVELFYRNRETIVRKAGRELDVKYILDIRDFPESPYRNKIIRDVTLIYDDPEVDIVAEAMGGVNPALEFTKECLSRGKTVVTSNKELVACHGAQLLAIAKANNCNYLFEASVGGGIPVIRPIHQCLSANEVGEIVGILNGTSNYILTRMITDNMDFQEALSNAQALGYAEKDPTADVGGQDTNRKLCILASLAFGRHLYPDQVHVEGITEIKLEDVAYANDWGGEIKLLGRVQRFEDGKILPVVCPAFVARTSQLSTVDDVFNGIMIKADALDKVMFYGRGAGKFPTASAMMADIIEAAKASGTILSQHWEDGRGQDFVLPYTDAMTAKYIRVQINCPPEEAAGLIASTFNNAEEQVEYLTRQEKSETELAFVTPVCRESDYPKKQKQLEAGGKISVLSSIRILDCSFDSLA